MRVHFVVAILLFANTPSLALPQPISTEVIVREADASALTFDTSDLWKRKGGGGGGGKGGGSSSSGGSSSGSSSSGSSSSGSSGSSSGSSGSGSSSGSSGSSSSSSSGKGLGSSSSSNGGSTKTGSGVRPAYGGGRYYGGGATVPYSAGRVSPLGITPFFFGASLLAFYPGLWLYGAWAYPYHNPYTFRNHSATNTTSSTANRRQESDGVNQTKPVTCLCAQYQECGCDDSSNTTFLDSIIGDGDYFALNQSLVTVADVNGTSTIILNGTLPNGTTASGGTADANVAAGMKKLVEASGYWVMIALVGCTVSLV